MSRQEKQIVSENKKIYVEEFSDADLSSLRDELTKAGLDSWQGADLISSFLVERGYGVSTLDARKAAPNMESAASSLQSLQAELKRLAYVM